MLRRSATLTLRTLSSFTRHQSTVGTFVSKIQHDVLPVQSPLTQVINDRNGSISLEDLIALREEQESPLNMKQNTMSCLSGLTLDTFGSVMAELRSQLESPSVQAFLISELLRMVRTGDFQGFRLSMNHLSGEVIGPDAAKLVSKLSLVQEQSHKQIFYRILTDMCTYWRNPLLAATVALGPEFVSTDNAFAIIRSLLVKNPRHEEISLDLIMKIGSKYDYKFNEAEVTQIMEKLAEVNDKSALLKRVALFLLERVSFTTRALHIKKIYEMIMNDAYVHNTAGVYLNWRCIMNEYGSIMDHDIRVVAAVIQSMLKSRQYHTVADEVISQIPEKSYTHAFLIRPLLDYAYIKNDIAFANRIISRLEPPVPKEVLSTLLKINMRLGDYTGMESVMQQITSMGGMSSQDYTTIVNGLLKRGDFIDAVKFARSVPVKQASGAYLKILNYSIDTKGEWRETEFAVAQDLLSKMSKVYPVGSRPSRGFWNVVGSLYIKYLTKNFGKSGVRDAQKVYDRSVKDFALKAYGSRKVKSPILEAATISTNPFVEVPELRGTVRLLIDARSKPIVVKTIMDAAKRLKMRGSVNWAMLELVELGATPREVKVDITRKYNGHAKKVGLRDWESQEMFENLWEQGSVEFAKEGVLKDIPENLD